MVWHHARRNTDWTAGHPNSEFVCDSRTLTYFIAPVGRLHPLLGSSRNSDLCSRRLIPGRERSPCRIENRFWHKRLLNEREARRDASSQFRVGITRNQNHRKSRKGIVDRAGQINTIHIAGHFDVAYDEIEVATELLHYLQGLRYSFRFQHFNAISGKYGS